MNFKSVFYFSLLTITSICHSDTSTGPCDDPLCDSVNVIEIYKKLGVDINVVGNFFTGERIDGFHFRCLIDSFPEEIGNLTELTSLTISGQFSPGTMKYIPASIGNLTKLQKLDLSNNRLEELPPEIGRLVNLRELYLQNNNLQSLPDSIVNIVNLEPQFDVPGYHLDIERNHICSLPPALSRWADTMLFSPVAPGDSGKWMVTQCPDCPNGQAAGCETSARPGLRPHDRVVPPVGVPVRLYDLQGNRIKKSTDRSVLRSLPRGCYILRYGGNVPQYRRYVVP